MLGKLRYRGRARRLIRANIRGPIRRVMVTDSDDSLGPATADSIKRRSGRFSDQKSASASSLSKMGTSSHLAIARMFEQSVNQLEGLNQPLKNQASTTASRGAFTSFDRFNPSNCSIC